MMSEASSQRSSEKSGGTVGQETGGEVIFSAEGLLVDFSMGNARGKKRKSESWSHGKSIVGRG